MRDYLSHEVRNVVVLGHSGVGKTAVLESMLYFTKASDRFGVTSEGSSLIDYDAEEIRRGISVYATLVPIEWKDCKINFLDTPGYADFIRGVEEGVAVGDSALIVVDAKDVVQPGTQKAWEEAQKHNLPTIFFVNKLDEENTSFDTAYQTLRDSFGKSVIPFEVPIMENGKCIGSVNILRDKAWYFEGPLANSQKAQPVPENMVDIVKGYKDQIAEAVAMGDDELMEKFFSGEEFSEAELTRGVRLGVRSGDIRPVFSGSATHSVGIERLMDLIIKYFPTYGESGSITVHDEQGKDVVLETNEKEKLCAKVFKTVVDPFVGRITYVKVLAGVMSADSVVYNTDKEKQEKISGIFIIKGKHQTAVGKLFTGDIGAVVKLQYTQTNDTLCEKNERYVTEDIPFSTPMLAMAVYPASKNDEDKMSNALARMVEEDPTLRLENNTETKQSVLYGVGDQHLDVVLAKLKAKYKVEVRLETPRVPYRETIRKTAIGEGRHKKQSGGHGQFGHVFIEYAPNPDVEEMVFEEKVFGGAVPRQYFPAVEAGLRECMTSGILAGFKVVHVKATLLDGKYHDVDSSEMAFKLAARLSYKAGMAEAKPILLEPIVNITVRVPDDFTGTIIGDFNKRRGAIMGMDMVDGYQEIKAQVPLAELLKYPIELRAMTQGRGVYTQEFDRYDPVPQNLAERIIAQHKKEMEE
ncbi:elongation factor G [Amedibacillus dolichus]|uniref:Putative translation elongation factor G n=1 Tax=Amedibacillus dolichus DSM 3991 TaxID=428127 RepID=A8RE82_9FIRM|nr:elongation factor G [Amedibacillus dolichus]EDP10473.1 putative translation elongation factor G [Amedibacillus dolichus DSM 3991]